MKKILKIVSITLLILILVPVLLTFLPGYSYLRTAVVYQNADINDYEIFENRVIEKGEEQPWKEAKNFNEKQPTESQMKELEKYKSVAFLVIQNNEIKYEKYWDSYGRGSKSNSFSMAKSVVALLIGIAIEEGHIDSVGQKVGDFLPQFAEGENNSMTIKDLLTMSSGLDWDESYGSPFSITTKAYYGSDLEALIKELKVVETPGKEWKYLSGNTQVLAFILKAATGKSISEYASEKLWKPLGAENDALWSLDKKDGDEKAYCCLNTDARDFARLGQLVLQKGKWNDKQIVPEKYIEEAITPAEYLTNSETGEKLDFYGYQFWILNYNDTKIPYFRGILGQYIFVIPEKNAVVVRLGHERSDEYRKSAPIDVYTYLDIAYSLLD